MADIKRRAAELKQDIGNYRENCLKKVEEYVTDLKRKAENLESIQPEVKRFLRESNTATIISEKETRDKEFLEAHSLDTSTGFHYDEQTIIKHGGKYGKNSLSVKHGLK